MGDGSESSDDGLARRSSQNLSLAEPRYETHIELASTSSSNLRLASPDVRRAQRGMRTKDATLAENDAKLKSLAEYDAKLKKAKLAALITATLHSFNTFLGYCALTWATVVILGGYVSDLSKNDFLAVSVLLLLEALRLAVAIFFANIVTRNLVYRSTDPTKLRYDDSDRQKIVVGARVVGQAGQVLFIAFTIIFSLRRFPHVGDEVNADSFDGLRYSLRIFYSLVVLNGIVSASGVLHSIVFAPLCVTSYSLRKYYDEVVWRGMCMGLLEANNFDFLKFAFKTQSEEYRQNMRAPVVGSLYKDLLQYLYWHKKGFEATRNALDSSDSSQQEAAANIVGLWTKLYKGENRLRLQRRLLSKLADMVDNQETGRAAVLSFEHLAKIDAKGLQKVQSESGNKFLIDILIERIEEVVDAGKYDKTLVYLKALISMLEEDRNVIDPQKFTSSLVGSLRLVFKSESFDCLKRTKAVAGHALRMLTEGKEPNEEDVTTYLKHQELGRQQHILEDEEIYLSELLGSNRSVLDDWCDDKQVPCLKRRKVKPSEVPPFSVHKVTIVCAFIVSALVVGGAWIFDRYCLPF